MRNSVLGLVLLVSSFANAQWNFEENARSYSRYMTGYHQYMDMASVYRQDKMFGAAIQYGDKAGQMKSIAVEVKQYDSEGRCYECGYWAKKDAEELAAKQEKERIAAKIAAEKKAAAQLEKEKELARQTWTKAKELGKKSIDKAEFAVTKLEVASKWEEGGEGHTTIMKNGAAAYLEAIQAVKDFYALGQSEEGKLLLKHNPDLAKTLTVWKPSKETINRLNEAYKNFLVK